MALKIQIGYGWIDDTPPTAIQELLNAHSGHGKSLVFEVEGDSHLLQAQGGGFSAFYGNGLESDAVAMTADKIAFFLNVMMSEEADVTTFAFVNFAPRTFSLSPRPEPARIDTENISEGLSIFLSAVAESIQGSRVPEEAMWSKCDWAMITCFKLPE